MRPTKIAREALTVRLPVELKRAVEQEAAARWMTTTAFLCHALEKQVALSRAHRAERKEYL